MSTGFKQMENLTWVLGSFLSVKRSGALFDNKVLFKNNRPILFQLFLKLTELQTTGKTMSLLFLNNTLFLRYSSKEVH